MLWWSCVSPSSEFGGAQNILMRLLTSIFSSNLLKPYHLRRGPQRSFGRTTWRSNASSSSVFPSSFSDPSSNMLFKLNDNYVQNYATKVPPFGFNGLGELVYMRTYSRANDKNQKESWYQTVERVVNGTYSLQKEWMLKTGMPWDEASAQEEAKEMYDRMFTMKFLPPGRGLWAMGSPLTQSRKLFAALNNCAFVSTVNLVSSPTDPFCFLMDAAMLGVGVGFDTVGANTVRIRCISPSSASEHENSIIFTIPDSREGWVESLRILLDAFLNPQSTQSSIPKFNYHLIRPAGIPIKGFGGTSQGPGILREMHETISSLLQASAGELISVTLIVDIMNLIGKCVVSGNIRRTAEIAFGDPQSDEYISLKDYKVNPQREAYGWTSNNSVFAELGMDYQKVCEKVAFNGEPGFAWLENMKAYGRMCSEPDYLDYRAKGGNPCLEQTLESYEMCCLVETFPSRHESKEDFLKTLKIALTYAKTVTLGPTHWPQSNAIMLRNRRIGTSLSGIAQFIANNGIHTLKDWCEDGYSHLKKYDELLSEKFGIPLSIKLTCIKPSGTVSLLAGSTPGMHFPESRFYIRRVRISNTSELLEPIRQAGYKIEKTIGNEESSVVVEFPIDCGEGVRVLDNVTMWEQLGLAAFLQRYWADNQVSCTVTFDPETEGPQLQNALNLYQYQLKGISFLPRKRSSSQEKASSTSTPQTVYPQMPYEMITEERYQREMSSIQPFNLQEFCLDKSLKPSVSEVPDKFCDSAGCIVQSETIKEL